MKLPLALDQVIIFRYRDGWNHIYNFGLFTDCADSPGDGTFFREDGVASLTGRTEDLPVLRENNVLTSSHILRNIC